MLHTKLPWIHQPDYNDVGNACIDISSEEGAHVVEIYDSHDAAFIVKACNNHYRIKDSLWLAHEHMKLYLPHYKEGFSVHDNLEEAIKQAETEK